MYYVLCTMYYVLFNRPLRTHIYQWSDLKVTMIPEKENVASEKFTSKLNYSVVARVQDSLKLGGQTARPGPGRARLATRSPRRLGLLLAPGLPVWLLRVPEFLHAPRLLLVHPTASRFSPHFQLVAGLRPSRCGAGCDAGLISRSGATC